MNTYRIGIDVGGTNTDAALLNEDLIVIDSVKTPTKADPGSSVATAIHELLERVHVPASSITAAMLGTTHCTNAIVERKGLGRVGVLRLGAPATTSVPPFEGWPQDLRNAVEGPTFILSGGHEYNGREIATLDEEGIERACLSMRGQIDALAIIGTFSPVTSTHEDRAREIASGIVDVPITCSAEVGSMGLLERENATIFNGALIHTLSTMATGFRSALESEGLTPAVFFGQNDGTLMQLDYALRFPVFTIGCGPTNSIRGAAHLCDVSDALVVDIGGTTTDIGVLTSGFPRQSAHAVEIGGIRTNFRMPDILSVGLGGGTIVRGGHGSESHEIKVGPDSVGYRITEEALIFGGRTCTATDIAAASGRLTIRHTLPATISETTLAGAEQQIRDILETSIDRMKTTAADVDVILVGGGAPIASSNLKGVGRLHFPDHAASANAVGAALGDVAGQCENVVSLLEVSKSDALIAARQDAVDRAISAGASPDTVEVLSVEEFPVPYMEKTLLIRARAAGKLQQAKSSREDN